MGVPGRSRGGFVQQFVQHFELLGCCHPGQGEPRHHVPARAQAAASASAAGAMGGGPALARSEWRTLAERLRPALPRKLDSVPPPVGGAIVTTSGRALAWVGTMSPANRVGYVMKYCKTFVWPGCATNSPENPFCRSRRDHQGSGQCALLRPGHIVGIYRLAARKQHPLLV